MFELACQFKHDVSSPGFGGRRVLAAVDGEVAVPDATGLRPGQEMG